MKSFLFFFALAFLINLHQYCRAVDDLPGSRWNSITQSMSKDEIEQLKKMAMPSFPQITEMTTSSTDSRLINQEGVCLLYMKLYDSFLLFPFLLPTQTNKKKLSQRPATVARRKRLEKLKIKVRARNTDDCVTVGVMLCAVCGTGVQTQET